MAKKNKTLISNRIDVLGDVMLDEYIFGKVTRVSPEAPVPILEVERSEFRPGGSANVAHNFLHFNQEIYLHSESGDTQSSTELLKILQQNKKFHSKINFIKGEITSHKTRIIGNDSQLVRIDRDHLKPASKIFKENFLKLLPSIKNLIIADYGKGVIDGDFIKKILTKKRTLNSLTVFIDPNPNLNSYDSYKGCDFLTPNLKEFEKVVGHISSNQELVKKGKKLKKAIDCKHLLVTLGSNGMCLIDNMNHHHFFPALAKEVFDVSGAGDTVISMLALAVSQGKSIIESINFANAAAAVVVGKVGTDIPHPSEVNNLIGNHSSKLQSLKQLMSRLSKVREYKKIVVTNGCFDIMHPGHLYYLREASKFGDIFIIALNSDSSVKLNKGAKRPINNFDFRSKMLSELEFVDFIVKFDEDTPSKIYEKIRPDIIVKGGDYSSDEVVTGKLEYKPEIKIVKFHDGFSTTKVIENILNLYNE